MIPLRDASGAQLTEAKTCPRRCHTQFESPLTDCGPMLDYCHTCTRRGLHATMPDDRRPIMPMGNMQKRNLRLA